MRWLSALRYTSKDSGPLGYGNKVLLISLLPFVPLMLLDVRPMASALTKGYFWLSTAWFVAVAGFGLREMWNAIWSRSN